MPYDAVVSEPAIRFVDGVKYVTYTVVEEDVGADDEFTLGVPTPGVVWLYEAHISAYGGEGTPTLDPELGFGAAWTADTVSEVWVNGDAAAHIRAQPDARIGVLPVGTALVGRSKPSETVDEVTTRITLRVG